MSLVRVVIYKGGVPAVLPFIVVLGNFDQVPILVDVFREDEHAGLGRVTKAGWRRSREFANEHGRVRSHIEAFVGEKDRDGVEARRLAFLVGNDVCDSAVIEPECLSTVSQGNLDWLDVGLERRDEDGFVVSVQGSVSGG
jgi:hypothetical protein